MFSKLESEPKEDKIETRKVVIEVGAERTANLSRQFPRALVDQRGQSALYIPVNLEFEKIDSLKAQGDIYPVVVSPSKFPFREESADEIWMVNVIGSPHFLDFLRHASNRSIAMIFSDYASTLKKGGTLIIGETYTPNVSSRVKSVSNAEWHGVGLQIQHLYDGNEAMDYWESFGYELSDRMRKSLLAREGQRPFFLTLEKL